MNALQVFAITALDHPDSSDKRAALRPAHLEWLQAHAQAMLLAGPLRHEKDGPVIGSSLVIQTTDKNALQAMLDADPYAKGGLFAAVYISHFQPVMGSWLDK